MHALARDGNQALQLQRLANLDAATRASDNRVEEAHTSLLNEVEASLRKSEERCGLFERRITQLETDNSALREQIRQLEKAKNDESIALRLSFSNKLGELKALLLPLIPISLDLLKILPFQKPDFLRMPQNAHEWQIYKLVEIQSWLDHERLRETRTHVHNSANKIKDIVDKVNRIEL
jgi:hypothetical protein